MEITSENIELFKVAVFLIIILIAFFFLYRGRNISVEIKFKISSGAEGRKSNTEDEGGDDEREIEAEADRRKTEDRLASTVAENIDVGLKNRGDERGFGKEEGYKGVDKGDREGRGDSGIPNRNNGDAATSQARWRDERGTKIKF